MGEAELRGRRFGWVFAAVWLFYLNENLSALLGGPAGWRRDVGLVALAGFAVSYLALVAWLSGVRHGGWARYAVLRLWVLLLGLLVLAALQVPGAGFHALTCLVYVAASAMIGLPLRQAVPFAAALVVLAEVLAWRVPGWDDRGYGLAVLLGAAASGGIRLAAERQRRLQATQQEL